MNVPNPNAKLALQIKEISSKYQLTKVPILSSNLFKSGEVRLCIQSILGQIPLHPKIREIRKHSYLGLKLEGVGQCVEDESSACNTSIPYGG